MSESYELHVKVAGVTFEGRQAVLAWMDGYRDWFETWGAIHLLPEPTNEYDPNAIQVLAVCAGGTQQCGYVPRDKTKAVHELLQVGAVEVRVLKLDTFEEWGDDGQRDVWYLRIAIRPVK